MIALSQSDGSAIGKHHRLGKKQIGPRSKRLALIVEKLVCGSVRVMGGGKGRRVSSLEFTGKALIPGLKRVASEIVRIENPELWVNSEIVIVLALKNFPSEWEEKSHLV